MNSTPTDAAGNGHRQPASRCYGVAFSEVWDALLTALGSLRGWSVHETDSRAGTVRATTTNALGRLAREATFTLRLDHLGQTCLDIHFEPAAHALLEPAAAARARRLIRRLERLLERRPGRS